MSWLGPVRMNGVATQLTAAANADGHLEVFYTDTAAVLKHNWQTAPDSLLWNGEESFGVAAKQFAVGVTADGRLELFFIDPDNALRHAWQDSPVSSPGGQSWTFDPNPLSHQQIFSVTVGADALGRLQIFYSADDHTLYLNRQKKPASADDPGSLNSWAGETGFWNETAKGQLALAVNFDKRLELFLLGTDSRIYHAWQIAPSTSLTDSVLETWSRTSQLWNQEAKSFTVGTNADGRLELFYVGANGGLDHDWQTELPSLGKPNVFGQKGQRFGSEVAKSIAVGLNLDQLQELWYAGTSKQLHGQQQAGPAIASAGANLDSWTKVVSLPIETDVNAMAMATQASGLLDLFYVGSDNQLYNVNQLDPGAVLGSNVNQLLFSGCDVLTDVVVEIEITQDVICAAASGSTKGFSFQLNAYSQNGFKVGWQQYVIALFGRELICAIDNWTPDGKSQPVTGKFNLQRLPAAVLPAGTRLLIQLVKSNASVDVDNVGFSLLSATGSVINQVAKSVRSLAGGDASALAPITAFELNVVGPVNSENCILSSGAGTISYRADQPLTPIAQLPTRCVETRQVTAEWANTVYSTIVAGRANQLTQTFAAVVDAKQVSFSLEKRRPSLQISAEMLEELSK